MPLVALKTEGLSKRYGSLQAVKNLSLEVYDGEVLGFLGPNGAGKTTAIGMMCGLLRPTAGTVTIHGVLMRGGEADARARVVVCPQDIVVWKQMSCLEQLQFIGEMYGVEGKLALRRGGQLLEQLGLSEKRHALARTLSGGMQRRLNLALALVHDPTIVVLDEPEAGLDPQSRVAVREFIRSIAGDKTIILTTHNMDEAERVADRVAIIDHGELLILDTPESLKRSVGEGDVVEIDLDAQNGECARRALVGLVADGSVHLADRTLVFRALSAIQILPEAIQALKRVGLRPGEVRLRANTLEDVFIKLTGRGLRE
jgi:ABC-2 type transport system ATP-binding protein